MTAEERANDIAVELTHTPQNKRVAVARKLVTAAIRSAEAAAAREALERAAKVADAEARRLVAAAELFEAHFQRESGRQRREQASVATAVAEELRALLPRDAEPDGCTCPDPALHRHLASLDGSDRIDPAKCAGKEPR